MNMSVNTERDASETQKKKKPSDYVINPAMEKIGKELRK